jgi:hypothetical protein
MCRRRRGGQRTIKGLREKIARRQSIDYAAYTTVELLVFNDRFPCDKNHCIWTDMELTTKSDLLKNLKSNIINDESKVARQLQRFPNLQDLKIVIEVPYHQRDRVHSPSRLARIRPLLALPGARLFVHFETRAIHIHPTAQLMVRWHDSWDPALKLKDSKYRLHSPDSLWKD